MSNEFSILNLSPVFWASMLAGLVLMFYWLRAYNGSSYGSIRVESDERQRRPRQEREREDEEHILPPPEVIAIVLGMALFLMLAAAGLIR